jgi:hypothetical protein
MKKNKDPNDLIISYNLNKEDVSLFFPWLFDMFNVSNDGLKRVEDLYEPKKKRGRKPKPHRSHDNNIFETKSSIN